MRFSACPASQVALYIGVSNWNWNSAWANVVCAIYYILISEKCTRFVCVLSDVWIEREGESFNAILLWPQIALL